MPIEFFKDTVIGLRVFMKLTDFKRSNGDYFFTLELIRKSRTGRIAVRKRIENLMYQASRFKPKGKKSIPKADLIDTIREHLESILIFNKVDLFNLTPLKQL